MKNFALIGAAGYIAPRHIRAIKETGNHLVAATDPHDSVGVLDQYFYDVSFFTEFERFDRHLEKEKRKDANHKTDFISICSPNHLHDAHIRFALRIGSDAICEKPLVVNPWNLEALEEIENETGKKVFTILQLRAHESLIQLKEVLKVSEQKNRHIVVLTYITSRGPWYHYSWKGSVEKSGGIATNIGVHFFDLLYWLFGSELRSEVHFAHNDKISGYLELENADVSWYLSTDRKDLQLQNISDGKNTFRSISIDGKEIDFTRGFENLHTRVYENILKGNGFGIKEAKESIKMVYNIRHANICDKPTELHPYLRKILKK